MAELFEAIMVVSFGLSWPLAILKSYQARATGGKSLLFLLFILVGYAFGIMSKIVSGTITYVFAFYVLNFIMVSIDVALYFRNRNIERKEGRK